jgi:sec-independent protein translocase protein TatB
MFDVGWIEMAVIALIALVVIGPKELPKAMGSLAKWTRKARSMAREFQSGIDDMVREADLDEARKAVESAKSFNVGKAIEETVDPTGGLRDEAKELENEMAREAESEAGGDAGGEGAEAPKAARDSAERATEGASEGEAGAEAEAEAGAEAATVVEHPHSIAPPVAATPPPGPEAATPDLEPVAAAVDGDDTKRRA